MEPRPQIRNLQQNSLVESCFPDDLPHIQHDAEVEAAALTEGTTPPVILLFQSQSFGSHLAPKQLTEPNRRLDALRPGHQTAGPMDR